MISLLSYALLLFPQQTEIPTDQLTAQLLSGHPAIMRGDYDTVRNDWLTAVEQDFTSPLVATALQRIAELDQYCAEGIDAARLGALLEGAHDGAVAKTLQDLLLREVRRTRFSEESRPLFVGDMYTDWCSNFRVLGPVGPLGHPVPLTATHGEPELFVGTALEPTNGLELTWVPLKREANQYHVRPNQLIREGQGSVFVTTLIEAPTGLATLEVVIDESARVYWNHTEVLDLVRTGLTDTEPLHRVVVEVRPGWNQLTIQSVSDDDAFLAARLLTRQGQVMSYREWDSYVTLPQLPQVAGAPGVVMTPPMPEANDAWSQILAMHMARLRNRPDMALAMAKPAGMEAYTESAWLLARHDALSESFHLPFEITRQRILAVEARLKELEVTCVPVAVRHIDTLLEEDRREDAALVMNELLEKYPDNLEVQLAATSVEFAFDPTGVLARPRLLALTEQYPQHPMAFEWIADMAMEAGDRDTELTYRRLAEAYGDGGGSTVIELLAEGGEADREEALAMLERIQAEEPKGFRNRSWIRRIAHTVGDYDAVLAELEGDMQRAPARTSALYAKAELLLLRDKPELAKATLHQILERDGGEFQARIMLDWLGETEQADRFFEEFAPDHLNALTAKLEGDTGSVTKMLDSGMIYLWPDGSYRYRVHEVDLAQNRRGTEELHEIAANGTTLKAIVHKTDGTMREPHLVDDSWVMPDLNPGDRVEMMYDRRRQGTPGMAPMLNGWFFQSLDLGFAVSRFVVFVPEGLPGEFVSGNFDGTHEVLPWEGGQVHIYSRENSMRLQPEASMPSRYEVLPWVDYGIDTELDRVAANWDNWYTWQSAVPADIEVELREFLAGLTLPTENRARAAAIFQAMDQEILAYDQAGDVTDVWTQKRGNPTGLMLALLRLAEVPVIPAVSSDTAASLDPDPKRPFSMQSRFTVPVLLVPGGATEENTWIMLTQRGLPFASIPQNSYGAEVLLLTPELPELTTLPEEPVDGNWMSERKIDYVLQRDNSAIVDGSFVIHGTEGSSVREMIRDLTPEERKQAKQSIVSSVVPGMDIDSAEFVGLEQAGAGFTLTFHGRVPDFVIKRGEMFGARLNLPSEGMTAQLGTGDRELDLAMRMRMSAFAQITLDGGGAWTIDYGPETSTINADGLDYQFLVEKNEHKLKLTREVRLDGLYVTAGAFPDFLAQMREMEQQEQRAARLFPVPEPVEIVEEVVEEPVIPDTGLDTTIEEPVAEEPVAEEPAQTDGE